MDTQHHSYIISRFNAGVLLFLLSLLTFSPVSAANKDHLITEVYEAAQVNKQLSWIIDSMQLEHQHYQLPAEVIDTVNRIVHLRYNMDFFRSSMFATLDEALSSNELLTLLNWYSSELGQKIRRLEVSANDPGNARNKQLYIEQKLLHGLPRTRRTQLIDDLIRTLDAVELGAEVTASASVGARRLLNEVMPMRNGHATRVPTTMKAQEKAAIHQEMVRHMRNTYLYTYRNLSDSDIQTYLEFARSSAMQNFQRGQIQAIARML